MSGNDSNRQEAMITSCSLVPRSRVCAVTDSVQVTTDVVGEIRFAVRPWQ